MEYEKDELIYEITESEKNSQLIQSIIRTQIELNRAHNNFDYAEEELVDFYSYQIKALQSKLDYLTKLAKIKKLQFKFQDKKAI